MFGRRLIAVGLCGAAGLVIAACGGETNPATNVTSTSATLNAHASCQAGESGKWWFRWRPTGNPWRETPRNSYDCATDDAQDMSANLTGLTPATEYEYQVCAKPTNPFVAVCANADGHADNADRDPGEPTTHFTTLRGPPQPRSTFNPAASPPPATGGIVVRSDTAADPDAHHLWGVQYACANDSRVTNPQTGGDPGPTASGAPQGNSAYRRLTVYDGDNYSGERCELGYNEWDGGLATPSDQYGAFYNYFEGDRRTTYFSVRLPDNFPLNATKWQGVGQMKQAAPNCNTGAIPVLSFSAYNGVWRMDHTSIDNQSSDSELWETPAQKNVWTQIKVDALYSRDPSIGWVQYSIDSNGDGDFSDPGEVSPVFHTNTLMVNNNCTFSSDSYTLGPGGSIPSHLRVGLYHNPSIPCPAPSGCSVDIDNVQVVRP